MSPFPNLLLFLCVPSHRRMSGSRLNRQLNHLCLQLTMSNRMIDFRSHIVIRVLGEGSFWTVMLVSDP
jgi:hypothetical protein